MTREQRELAQDFYDHSLWEFTGPFERETFREAWERNMKHLRALARAEGKGEKK